jgi:hypothetical protein
MLTEQQIIEKKGEPVLPTELTVEDLEELSNMLELDESYRIEEALKLCREEEENDHLMECRCKVCTHSEARVEFDGSEDAENWPD